MLLLTLQATNHYMLNRAQEPLLEVGSVSVDSGVYFWSDLVSGTDSPNVRARFRALARP